jgi:hypothetical protein
MPVLANESRPCVGRSLVTLIGITTSANSTVTCLYSAGVVAVATAAPHSLQNFEFGGSSIPHDPHTKAAAVISTRPATVVPRHYRVTADQTVRYFSLAIRSDDKHAPVQTHSHPASRLVTDHHRRPQRVPAPGL